MSEMAKAFFKKLKMKTVDKPCAHRWTIDEQGHLVYCAREAGHEGDHESAFPFWDEEERKYNFVMQTTAQEKGK